MSKLAVLNAQGEQVDDVDLKEELFQAQITEGAIYYTAKAQLANRRQGTASTKSRGEVRGGGDKPWPQKGTGRSRQGTVRSPLWVGGAITFGPTPEKNHKQKVPRKVKRRALQSALSAKFRDNKLAVIDGIKLDEPKTKKIKEILGNLKIEERTLLVIDEPDENIEKSARNLPEVDVALAHQLNVLDLLTHEYLVLTREALQKVEEVFSR